MGSHDQSPEVEMREPFHPRDEVRAIFLRKMPSTLHSAYPCSLHMERSCSQPNPLVIPETPLYGRFHDQRNAMVEMPSGNRSMVTLHLEHGQPRHA